MIDHKFKKKYGQNFLQDNNIIKKIANTCNTESDDLIIEIGPGLFKNFELVWTHISL